MADSVEKWGDDIDSAVELALKDLKLTRDEVEVTVLEQPSKGFLGLFGSKLARVKVEKKVAASAKKEKEKLEKPVKIEKPSVVKTDAPAETSAPAAPVDKEPVKKEAPAVTPAHNHHERPERVERGDRPERSERGDRPERKPYSHNNGRNRNHDNRGRKPVNFDIPKMQTKFTLTAEDTFEAAQEEPAVKFVEEIAKNMQLSLEAEAGIIDSTLYINLVGKDVGSLIGKRGQTLDSIQYLASIVQNKDGSKHTRVIINAEKYREKREKTLQQLAKRISEKAVRSGKNIRLEPMNPYERKVIHSTLQNHPKVTTRSEGVEPNRRVIVEIVKK